MGQAQQFVSRVGFEHFLLLLDAEIENRTQKISESNRLHRSHHRDANFRRNTGQERQRLLDHRLNVAFSRFDLFRILDLNFRQNLDHRTQIGIFLLPSQ